MRTSATDRASAYHEAGHVVVAYVLNTWVLGASIDTRQISLRDGRDGIADGYTDLRRRQKKNFRVTKGRLIGADRLMVVHKIAIALAGHAASLRATGNEAINRPNDGDSAEIDQLLKRVVQGAPRDDANRLLGEAQQLMAEELNEHWTDVARVAEALLTERTLTEGQIRAILSGPSKRRAKE